MSHLEKAAGLLLPASVAVDWEEEHWGAERTH